MKLIQTATFGVPEYEMKPQANYRPRISSKHLRRLRLLKRRTKKPIAKIVAEALDFYFENRNRTENTIAENCYKNGCPGLLK
jgi:hypothetical protein